MSIITTHTQADAFAKKLVPVSEKIEATVASEPVVYGSISFFFFYYLDKITKQPVTVRGSIAYIADNGKLITLSSNPLVIPVENQEQMLLTKYYL